ncbi:MAG: anthranilate phosphoribosyltransferase [Planctomycetota bacterium]
MSEASTTPPTEIQPTLAQLRDREPMTDTQAESIFEHLLTGNLDEAQVGALLALIQTRPPGAEELTGAARVMRRHVTRVPTPVGKTIVDTCGTGGAPKAFNISTAAAIIAAAAGRDRNIAVAKHGNRSRTGRGSAEVLAALGVNVDAGADVQAACLAEAGVCFCFAIHHHPAMRHAAGPRRSLGFPTIFNALGPLTNPAGARRQLLGVYDRALVEPMAQALAALGTEHAIVAHGQDGLDELTTTAPNMIATVRDGAVSTDTIDTTQLGLARSSFDALRVSSVEESAGAVRDVLAGTPGPRRDICVLNAAAAILVGGGCDTLDEGIKAAQDTIDSGDARATLESLASASAG